MRILLLACLTKNKSGNTFGGAEKSIINLANWLAENGHNVVLASVEGAEKSFPISSKVEFISYNINKRNKVLTHLQMFINTQNAFLKTKPDVVISFWIHPMFYLILNPMSKRAITIYSERNDPSLEYGIVSKFLRQFVLNTVSGTVFQTKDALSYFEKGIKCKTIVIHNPVYISPNDYSSDIIGNRIVSVGRLNYQKNFKLLIEAFEEVSRKFPDISLEIYGEGPQRKELVDLIDKLGIKEKVVLPGAYADVLKRIQGARLFVLSSHYEGMPNALMEAMCLGIPVISSDCPCGGPRELIIDRENGYLFECNSKADLVNKMVEALTNPDISSMQEKEQLICTTHSQDKIFNKWIDFIYSLK